MNSKGQAKQKRQKRSVPFISVLPFKPIKQVYCKECESERSIPHGHLKGVCSV